MRRLRQWYRQIVTLVRRDRLDRDIEDELAFHLAMRQAEHVSAGANDADAARAARRQFGNVALMKERTRDAWSFPSFESLLRDIRFGGRTLRRSPGLTIVAVLTLAVGIGITTAMFAILDALVLRPVPFHAPDQLALIYMGDEHGGTGSVAPSVLQAWRESGAFAAAESAEAHPVVIESDGVVATRGMARVTPGIFDLLRRVTPVRGRMFLPEEGRPGHDDRILLSEDLWRSYFHADPALVGRRVTIDRETLEVVGILPSTFRFPSWDTVIWRPIDFTTIPSAGASARPIVYVRFAANLPRPDALRVATDAARAVDAGNARLRALVLPLAGRVLDPYYQRAVPLLSGAVILVFLVLCANVSSLLLARLTARRREFAMCSALGASRARVMRQAFVETILMGVLGVIVGVGVGWLLVSIARVFLPEAFLLRTLHPLNLDARALAVASIAGVFATLAAGLLPAWIATGVDVEQSLRVTNRGGTETRGARVVTRTLLVAEIALACVLLVGATLLVRSFVNLAGVPRGLNTRDVIITTLGLRSSQLPDRASRIAAARAIDEQVRQLPGVQQVGWSYGIPPRGGGLSFGEWQSDVTGAPALEMTIDRYNVAADFFAAYGIPLLRGRTFQPADSDREVIVGERLARTLWPGLDPVGRNFSFMNGHFHVIGLVREIQYPSLDRRLDHPEFYQKFAGVGSYTMMSIRCGPCPDSARVRQRIAAAAGAVDVINVGPLDAMYFEQLAQPRAAAALAFAFAAIAALAAAAGLFSVLSYAVGRRRREFGIRTALGASPAQIRALVFRDGLVVVGLGVAIGTVGACALARSIASLQYGVSVADPVSWALVLGLLGVTVIGATWRPAQEAAHVDPVRLLREE
jgi:predicted permease